MNVNEIKALEDRHSTGVYPKRDVVMVRGEGAYLWDADGRRYIDCVGGQGTANVGHANPYVARALAQQALRLISCTEIFYNEERALLMSKLAAIAPPGLERVFLCNSGAEAIEGAIKFARLATGRKGIVAAMRGFHGRTMGALSATWEGKYREPFEPLVPGFSHVPYNNPGALTAAVDEDTAAVLLEIVQGEGGVRPATAEFLSSAQQVCRARGVLLVIDEVQTGFGRTGRMFACEHYGLAPDILCLAKSIAGGLPMGAVLVGERVPQLPRLVHGSTFGGNPLTAAAALAAIQYMEDYHLAQRAKDLGAFLLDALRQLRSPLIREVRGLGLLVGMELKAKVTPYLRALMEEGVLALPAGDTVLRLLPPLVIEREDLETVVAKITLVLRD
ncbi:MAG: acetylornithine/succinylornithine family transaminase [Chloroflexi bacterium]|nr:acetylornithine/succinylornithine family transaminase [Chloroflexota bacterium]